MRERLSREVRDILKSQGATAIMVTHDQNEAFAIADRVGVMQQGRLLQWDTPYRLYHEPATRYVADFIGQGVFLSGKVTGPRCVALEIGEFCGIVPLQFETGDEVDVLVRPDDVVHDDVSPTRARVSAKVFRGAEFHYTLTLPSGQRVLPGAQPSRPCAGRGDRHPAGAGSFDRFSALGSGRRLTRAGERWEGGKNGGKPQAKPIRRFCPFFAGQAQRSSIALRWRRNTHFPTAGGWLRKRR